MDSDDANYALRALRNLFVSFMVIAGLMLCVTAMHSFSVEHTENSGHAAVATLTGHVEAQPLQGAGVPAATTVSCQGPCDQDHSMMTATCGIALLVSLLLVGVARGTATWRPFARRVQGFVQRVGSLSPPMPPSLLALSISRT